MLSIVTTSSLISLYILEKQVITIKTPLLSVKEEFPWFENFPKCPIFIFFRKESSYYIFNLFHFINYFDGYWHQYHFFKIKTWTNTNHTIYWRHTILRSLVSSQTNFKRNSQYSDAGLTFKPKHSLFERINKVNS